ncbi:conserved hypothetical protein [Thiomonas arsenitoxydans]|uniref:Uncharacterized protein n=1 Tax=Thiomonas arsenitoxydans (strain DSM 22701 / CIP 110005 / 3As) TaxID=426114 RepID=D6CU52_THIA3|nr:hypothetical protein THI_2170 [Thiomonas arsenitoxydans]CQR35355.1 conserved hypothetical protein [Thiomonas arsenitoxydans]CQR35428.1 conserved hypothetical protein [Thiomonas arsenitoxydans]
MDGAESERLASREVGKKTWDGPTFSHARPPRNLIHADMRTFLSE